MKINEDKINSALRFVLWNVGLIIISSLFIIIPDYFIVSHITFNSLSSLVSVYELLFIFFYVFLRPTLGLLYSLFSWDWSVFPRMTFIPLYFTRNIWLKRKTLSITLYIIFFLSVNFLSLFFLTVLLSVVQH